MSKYYYKNSDGLEIKEGFKGDKKMAKSYAELSEEVLKWADDKDLLHFENRKKQFGKFLEEVFELEVAYEIFNRSFYNDLSQAYEDLKDMELEFGDVLVTLIILAEQMNINPMECLEKAYEKIKVRKGKTIDGTFVKEEDL